MLEKSLTPATDKATQQFDLTVDASSPILTLTAVDKNVNEVTVTVTKQIETVGTYDKDTTPIHTATSTTQAQGGLLDGGADTLDFSAYNVKGVVINNGSTDIFGSNAGTVLTPSADLFATAGNKFIYLEASKHDANIYDVYMATSKLATTVTDINFDATAGNAVKGSILGSIQLDDAADFTGMNASQLLF